jgi:hypothetical protein
MTLLTALRTVWSDWANPQGEITIPSDISQSGGGSGYYHRISTTVISDTFKYTLTGLISNPISSLQQLKGLINTRSTFHHPIIGLISKFQNFEYGLKGRVKTPTNLQYALSGLIATPYSNKLHLQGIYFDLIQEYITYEHTISSTDINRFRHKKAIRKQLKAAFKLTDDEIMMLMSIYDA